MKRLLSSLLVIYVAIQAGEACAQRFDDERRVPLEHGWTFDYDEALATARKTNRPLMVVFRCVP